MKDVDKKICLKPSARESVIINNRESDTDTGNWLTIDSSDDLFKYGMNIKFDKLNHTPLKLILKS